MDGVLGIVGPSKDFTYEFPARPAGFHVYHCHSTPLKKHIHKGLYGAFIVDPKAPREAARELVLVMNGYDTDGDGENNFYTVNRRTSTTRAIRSGCGAAKSCGSTSRTSPSST